MTEVFASVADDPLDGRHRFLEILDDRQGSGSTLVTSQFEPDLWHDTIGNPTVADAILDRLVHNAHHIKLGGPSIRKLRGKNK